MGTIPGPDPGAGQPEGTKRRFFRFGGNDPGGNIIQLQGFLSTAACPALAAIQSPSLNLPAVPPSGIGGPYTTPPPTNAGSPCNLHGQPVGPNGEPAGPPSSPTYCHFAFDPPSQSGGATGTIYLDDTNLPNLGHWLG